MNNVVHMVEWQSSRSWKAFYARHDKLDLLEDLVQYQELRAKTKGTDLRLVARGLALVDALLKVAETEDMVVSLMDLRKNLEAQRASA